jgi:hypothetical protein
VLRYATREAGHDEGLADRFSPFNPRAQSATFLRDILPILHKQCISCHRPGEVAPMPFITYQDAQPNGRALPANISGRGE